MMMMVISRPAWCHTKLKYTPTTSCRDIAPSSTLAKTKILVKTGQNVDDVGSSESEGRVMGKEIG
jgi:hypothetical protein